RRRLGFALRGGVWRFAAALHDRASTDPLGYGEGKRAGRRLPMTTMPRVDAVVIGSGPNGLVGANLLADAGWDVVVLEAAEAPGGAVRSAELTPGYVRDVCSAFYPLAVSPAP